MLSRWISDGHLILSYDDFMIINIMMILTMIIDTPVLNKKIMAVIWMMIIDTLILNNLMMMMISLIIMDTL